MCVCVCVCVSDQTKIDFLFPFYRKSEPENKY